MNGILLYVYVLLINRNTGMIKLLIEYADKSNIILNIIKKEPLNEYLLLIADENKNKEIVILLID